MTDHDVGADTSASLASHRRMGFRKLAPRALPGARRRHRRAALAATLGAVLAGASGVALVMLDRPSGPAGAPAAPVPAQSAGLGATDRAVADPRRVRATPEALLELLTRLFGANRTAAPAKSADGRLRVQLYLDDGKGPGMIRVGVTAAGPPGGCRPGPPQPVCRTLPDGSRVTISTEPDNCERSTTVTVHRPAGTRVDLDLAECLEFDGTTNPAGRLALSADQAVTVAADWRWGERMDRELVAAGAERFRQLRRTAMSEPAPPVSAATTSPGAAPTAEPARRLPVVVTDGSLQWEDVNGDGTDDYCRRIGPARGRTGRLACTVSTGAGFGPTITSPVLDWGARAGRDWEDVNGDNRTDYCRRMGEGGSTGRVACTLVTGSAFGSTLTSPSLPLGEDTGWAWDDANGDSKADYCRRLDRSGNTGRLACTLSTGSGFGITITSAELDVGRDVGWEWEDVNGDDKADYCRRLSPGGGTGRVACTLSTGSGFGTTITSAELDVGRDVGWDWEDVNGDDKADYCRRLSPGGGTGRVACTLSTGSGFGTTITSAKLDLGRDDGVAWEDVNGDKRADYCRLVSEASGDRIVCTPSTGTGFASNIRSSVVDRGQAIGARWVDLDSDQRKDFCRRVEQDGTRLACTLTTDRGFGSTVRSAVLDWGLDD